jgi:DNA topoisomerase-3
MLTAEWEHDLKRIEHGEMGAADFMGAINKYVGDTVKTHNSVPDEFKTLFPSDKLSKGNAGKGKSIGKCPRCGSGIGEYPKGFFCDNRACKFAIFKNSKYFTAKKLTLTKDTVSALLTKGRVFMSGLYSEKSSKTYNATIVLDDSGEGYPTFKMEFDSKGVKQNGQEKA